MEKRYKIETIGVCDKDITIEFYMTGKENASDISDEFPIPCTYCGKPINIGDEVFEDSSGADDYEPTINHSEECAISNIKDLEDHVPEKVRVLRYKIVDVDP